MSDAEVTAKNRELSKMRSDEVKSKLPKGENQWSSYPQQTVESPMGTEQTKTTSTGGA